MKIFASGTESKSVKPALEMILEKKAILNYNLMSFFYINKNQHSNAEWVKKHSKNILIDSGAHSMQFGAKANLDEYIKKYIEFIEHFDADNVVGFFELDIENLIGVEKVNQIRHKLEEHSNKIIPVWHPERGIPEYINLCKTYKNKIVAIGGFRKTDIKDEQFHLFLNTAKKYNCKVHCLGMTRKKVLDQVPFDFTDSATWLTQANFGHPIRNDGTRDTGVFFQKNADKTKILAYNYLKIMEMQEIYHNKWHKVCKN